MLLINIFNKALVRAHLCEGCYDVSLITFTKLFNRQPLFSKSDSALRLIYSSSYKSVLFTVERCLHLLMCSF